MRSGTRSFLTAGAAVLAAWLFLRYLLPLVSPFVLGLALALAAEPMVRFLHRRAGLPRAVSAGLGVGAAVCLAATVVLLVLGFALRELRLLAALVPQATDAARTGFRELRLWLLEAARHTPPDLQPLAAEAIDALFANSATVLERITGYLLGLAGSLLSRLPDSAFGLGTGIVSAVLFSVKLPRLRRWCLRRIPRQRLQAALQALRRLRRVLVLWLGAQCRLMGVTFVLVMLGLVVLRIPHALLWAAGICLVDAFPVLGTGAVLLPWSLLSLLRRDAARALGLLGIYVTVTLTRSALEPKLLGRRLGLDPLVTLMVLYAGYRLWGVAGMLLAPVLTVTALQLLPRRIQ